MDEELRWVVDQPIRVRLNYVGLTLLLVWRNRLKAWAHSLLELKYGNNRKYPR